MPSALWLVVLLPATPLAAQGPDSLGNLGEAFQVAAKASAGRDWKTARTALQAALRFSPENPAVLYNLARAEARLGNRAAAVRMLDRLARQGAVRPVQDDSAFASIRDARDFREVVRRLAAGAAPIARSDTAFVLPDPDFIPEGIAWDPADGAFYVGSLSGRGIVRLAGDSVSPWVRPDSTRLTQILGLRVDQPRRRLWVASVVVDTAAPRFLRGPGGWAALEAYQLPTGRRLGRWVPDSSGPHLLNDIAVTPAGDVYVTDSEGSALHRLAGGEGTLERVHHDPARFLYPNGIDLSPDGLRLYVAHWEGLSSFDLGAGGAPTPARVTAPAGVATTGIDGLYRCGDGLLAVQYLLDFPQITRFGLSARGGSVSGARTLERRHPAQTGPTTGARAKDAFYYIANAQLERLAEDQSVKPGAGERSVVLRMPLEGTCNG
jgi:sugar lactone lactonase YvrE